MTKVLILTVLSMLFLSCAEQDQDARIEKWKMEIEETEKDFANRVAEIGIRDAFLEFAAPDAVLMRDNKLIVGKSAIAAFMKVPPADGATTSLTWEPVFVSVAQSGDLGYTYGNYIFTVTDSVGGGSVNEGVFHTVWKKQPDGKWLFVWD